MSSLIGLLGAVIAPALPAAARPTGPVYIATGDAADAPVGFVRMCERDSALCALGNGAPADGLASGALSKLAARINHDVNRSVTGTSDLVTHGQDDYWSRPGTGRYAAGDCEDYAIEKRARLIEAGFPSDRLFYAVVFVRGFGLHTVLIARLDDGDHVLDNMSARISHWTKVRYVWLRVQRPGHPNDWFRPGRLPETPAYANRLRSEADAG